MQLIKCYYYLYFVSNYFYSSEDGRTKGFE